MKDFIREFSRKDRKDEAKRKIKEVSMGRTGPTIAGFKEKEKKATSQGMQTASRNRE